MKLICGNRNYSSWSLRAWLTLRKAGIDPELIVLPMDTPEFEERIAGYSPTRRVPVLWMGEEYVWDSLAIAETVSERYADSRLWPADSRLRALGRAMAAEMHSGFAALREELPMNCRARQRRLTCSDNAQSDVQRVSELWQTARQQSGSSTWLLGDFSIADAMFAPVAVRFNAYALDLPVPAQAYVAHWLADADLQEWMSLANKEAWIIEHEEVGE
ncbi:glutathione S-transferase [gamma proteobacterium NOR5-3]|nr:glutathione S-transferase [gamma proteobacterium NOR5-3]